MPKGEARFSGFREPVYALASVLGIGFVLGVLTAYAQGWLPLAVAPLANSSGSWSLVAFLSALLARDPRIAAFCGFASLVALLLGYVAGAAIRGYASGYALIAYWGAAAVFVGPFLGLGAYWLRHGRSAFAALGAGGMSGVLIGEGVYGLAYVAVTTGTTYWWGVIAFGVAFLAATILLAIRELRPALLAVGVCAAISAAFPLAYLLGGSLMMYL